MKKLSLLIATLYLGLFTVNAQSYYTDFDADATCNTTCSDPCVLSNTAPIWTNVTSDDLDWTVNNGGTPSFGTGPATDHTTGSGNYVYIESSGTCTPDSVAILQSTSINIGNIQNPTFKFWYHMYGGDMGNLYIEIDTGGGPWITIDSIIGEQQTANGDPWIERSIALNPYKPQSPVTLRLRGVTGVGFQSDIALDDIGIYEFPSYDVGVTEFLTPNTACNLSSSEPVTVVMENFGLDSIFSTPVNYQINSGPVTTETASKTIPPGDTVHYLFTSTANLSTSGTYTFDGWTSHSGDSINLNNDTTYNYNVHSGAFNYTVLLDTQCITTDGGSVTISANSYKNNWGGGTLTVYVSGDFGLASEYVDIIDESGDTLGQATTLNDCDPYMGATFSISQSKLSNWLADNQINIDASASGTVNNGVCSPNNCVYALLTYPTACVKDVGVANLQSMQNGRALTSLAYTSSEPISITVKNKGIPLSAGDTIPVSYQVNSNPVVAEDLVLTAPLPSNSSQNYTFTTNADLSNTGVHTIRSWTMLDTITVNDTSTIQVRHISNPPVTIPHLETFEATDSPGTYTNFHIGLDSAYEWDYQRTNPNGRLRMNAGAGFAHTGSQAATLDAPGGLVTNYIRWTVNLSNYSIADSLSLKFHYMDHGDESSGNDSVWIRGSDTDPWIGVYYLDPVNQTNGVYDTVAQINLSQQLAAAGQNFTTSFQVRFGEEDNFPASNPFGTDGITFDDIRICRMPANISFTDSSYLLTAYFDATGYNYDSLYWNFGDGNSGTGQSPVHMYAVDSTYFVQLIASNPCYSDTFSDSITITCIDPVANFGMVDTGLTLILTDSSQTTDNWFWDFGDGNTSTAQNPMHTYLQPDTYQVCLISSNVCGADTMCDSVVITCSPPSAQYTHSDSGLTISFTDVSLGATDWYWSFGDGNTDTLQNPTHMYAVGDTYQVCLAVNNICGTDTFCDSIAVSCLPPVANFGYADSGLNVSFTDSSQYAISRYWMFGDGDTSTAQNPNHNYSMAGVYNACLVVTNNCTSDTICDSIRVSCISGKPTADYGYTTSGVTVNFSDSSSGATSWYWTFGDGDTSTAQNPTHSYGSSGTYNVCLVASSICGTDTLCDSVTVSCIPPTSDFNKTVTANTVDFTDNSSFATSWDWDFGDGNSSTAQNPTHNYSSTGTYQVCLTVTNPCGTDSSCQSVSIFCVPPTAGFNYSTNGLDVTFVDNSSNGNSWFWDFGDGNIDSVPNPTYTYSSAGTYQVCMEVTNPCGTDTLCDSVSVTSTGIQTLTQNAVSVYPNPTTGKLHLQIDDVGFKQPIKLLVTNKVGQAVYQKTIEMTGSGIHETFDFSNKAPGIYFFHVTTNKESIVRKVVVQD